MNVGPQAPELGSLSTTLWLPDTSGVHLSNKWFWLSRRDIGATTEFENKIPIAFSLSLVH